MKTVTKYIADDGKEFTEEYQCKKHEAFALIKERMMKETRLTPMATDLAIEFFIDNLNEIVTAAKVLEIGEPVEPFVRMSGWTGNPGMLTGGTLK